MQEIDHARNSDAVFGDTHRHLDRLGIVKNLQVNILLLFAGLALNLLAVLGGVDSILPRGAHTTGWVGFDLFEQLRALSRNQVSTTGFIILVAGGFAAYMDKIGASDKLVAIPVPARRISNRSRRHGAGYNAANYAHWDRGKRT